jgi:hypothetical protein
MLPSLLDSEMGALVTLNQRLGRLELFTLYINCQVVSSPLPTPCQSLLTVTYCY